MYNTKKFLAVVFSFVLLFQIFPNYTYAVISSDMSSTQFLEETLQMIDEFGLYEQGLASSLQKYTNRIIVKTSSNAKIESLNAVASVEGFNNWHIFQFETIEDTVEAIDFYEQQDYVEYVEEDFVFLANNTELYLEDPVFDIAPTLDDYGSVMVNSGTAIEKITIDGNLNDVIVAVLDSGLAKEHPFFDYDRFQDDGSTLWGTSTDDGFGHGTHVSGIIYNNTPSCVKIRSYKVINDYNMGNLLSIASMVIEAVDRGADIINMSLGNIADVATYFTFSDAISYAKEKNVPVVVAAGNEYKELSSEIPATFTACITVASVNDFSQPSEFSNYGEAVDIAAPGEKINSTLPYENKVTESDVSCNNHYYATVSGTSMATPFITAAVAIILSLDNTLSVSDVETILKKTAQIPDNWNTDYGVGIVDFLEMTTLRKTAAPKITLTDNGAVITASPQAKIYYTIDGSTPIVGESDLYLGEPIKTSRVEKIKAIAYIEEQLPSNVAVFDVYWTENIMIRYKGRKTVDLDYEMEKYKCTNEEIVSFDGTQIKGNSIGKASVVIFYETGQRVIYNVTVKFADWQWFHKIFYEWFGILLWSF